MELKPDFSKFEVNQNPIIKAISNNRIKLAFDMLFEMAKQNNELKNELVLQKAAWEEVSKRVGEQTISEADANVQKARIRKNLVDMIEKFGLQ